MSVVQALLIGLCAWLCASGIEFTCWSIQLCSPIIFGPIVGAILGNPELGLAIGCATQLVYMGTVMVGGIAAVDYAMAGVVATALAVSSGASPEMGVTIAVTFGTFGMVAETTKMTLSSVFVHRADKYAREGNTRGIFLCNVVYPQIICFFLYFVTTFVICLYGSKAVTALFDACPEIVIHGLESVGMILPALGIAMLMKVIFKLKYLPYLIFGLVFSSYLGLGMIPVSLIGVGMAIIYWFNYDKTQAVEDEE